MTTGTNTRNHMRSLHRTLAYPPRKPPNRVFHRKARHIKLRPLFRHVHTTPNRLFNPSRPVILDSSIAGNGPELNSQKPGKCLLYLPKHFQSVNAFIHTSASESCPPTAESTQKSQNMPLALLDDLNNAPDSSHLSVEEDHGFKDIKEADAMLWAYDLWLMREEDKRKENENEGSLWTQKFETSQINKTLYVHRESLHCPSKPQLLVSRSAMNREEATRDARLLLISKLRNTDDWDEDLETAGYDGCKSFPDVLDIMTDDRSTIPSMMYKQKSVCEEEGKPLVHTCQVEFFINKRTKDTDPFKACNPRDQSQTPEIALKAAIRQLIMKLQLLKAGTLGDFFCNWVLSEPRARDVDEKDLDTFHQMLSLGRFKLELNGHLFCRANLYLPNTKRPISAVVGELGVPRPELEMKALKNLVSKLKKTDHWEISRPAVHVSVNDELIWAMQEAKKDLLQAEQFFNKHGPRHAVKPKSENSKNSGDPRWAENRSKQLSHSLNARRQSKDASIVDIRCQQNELPVVQIKRKVLDLIDQHTYSIIAAETGSGKSTQIPQMILDDATDQGIGGQCQVICVQPRRMAAQLLAARVSHERGEAVGDTVGCVTRFDHRKPAKAEGSITYCTTGIMLNIIQNRPEILSSLTHIMLDEVHVRDLEIDLIMLLLKRYVDQCRLNGVRVPKIVILSATIDLDLFSSYFTNIGLNGERIPAPHISIPGRQYEVKKHHLEDVLDDMATTFEPAILSRLLRGPETKAFLDKHYARFKGSKNSNTVTTNSALKNFSNLNRVPARIEVEDKLIPYGLTAALILHLLTTTTSGAILVFLPGLLPIEKLAQRILEFTAMKGFDIDFANQDRFRLLKLHAALPHEMAKLSQPFPKSCRRVFLSTDVAEASVTIPDVKYVIDSGRVNNVVYNHTGRSSRLGSFWASKSSIIQRAGRAGRVQNGEYFFLGNQKSFDELRKMKPPAIHHTSLDSVCLRMKSIAPDTPIRDVLEGAIEPPEADAVVQAIKHLIEKRALDKNENMTDLGILLNHLPIVPSAGKLIILGAIFHCLEPMLILAALEEKSLFRRPFDLSDGEVIRQKRLEFAEQSHSDNISAINAFKAIRDAERAGSDSARQYAETQHLDYRSYELARDLAKGPLLDSLKRTRIIGKSTPNDDCGHLGGKILNGNSNCIPLIKALILHAQFPQVVAPVASKKSSYFSKSEGLNLLAWMSVASIKPTPLSQDLLTYQVKISGDRPDLPPLLRGASLVSPLTMCLFGGRMVWKDGMFQMDSWLPLGVRMKDQTYTSNEAARAIVELHKAIDKTLKTVYEALVQQLYSTESYGTNEPINLKQMVRLWGLQKKLQKAVLATLEQDNHRFAVPGPGNWDEHGLELDEDEFIQEDSLVRADNSEFDGETSVQ